MKLLFCFVALFSLELRAQDPLSYLKAFDSKVYSLKQEGIKEFVVDIESTRLTKQMNEQQLFGKVDGLIFRVYWTAVPERLAIEVMGLPEGFKEVKEDLKNNILPLIDNILPLPTAQRFSGYKFTQGKKQREILATDTSGLAPIPSYSLLLDEEGKLKEVTGHRPVGSLVVTPTYETDSLMPGKWLLKKQITMTVENGQKMTLAKKLDYGKGQRLPVVTAIEVTTEYASESSDTKPVSMTETIEFKNYKINEGVAFKYFLGESKGTTPDKTN